MSEDLLDFGKVLEKDLANIIKKAAAGQPLNARERDLIMAEKAKREKEKAETPPAPDPAPAPKKKTGRASRTGFQESYEFYAERYGASPRTLKRWVKIGKDQKPDPIPCPLDAPEQMRGWWAACMTLRCPEGVLAAEVEALKAGATAPALQSPPDPDAAQAPAPVIDLGPEEKGLAAAMTRLEKMEIEFSKKATEPGQAKTWFDAIARMTSLAANVRKELEAQDLLAPRSLVAQELRDLLQPVESGIRGMYATFCQVLEMPSSPKIEGEWLKQCDKLFERFGKEVFSDL